MTSGSITLPGFKLTSGGVLTLDGTSNNTTVGANLINVNTLRVANQIMASGASFNIGGMYSTGSYVHGSFMGDFHGSFYESIRPAKEEKNTTFKGRAVSGTGTWIASQSICNERDW